LRIARSALFGLFYCAITQLCLFLGLLKGGGAMTHATACSVDGQFRRHFSTPAACTCACAREAARAVQPLTLLGIRAGASRARHVRLRADGTCACMHARSPRGLPPRSHCRRALGTRTRTRAPAHARSASTFFCNMPPYSPTAPVNHEAATGSKVVYLDGEPL
jgi:hypothetical protein